MNEDELRDEIEALLKAEIDDFKDEVKAEAGPFLKEKATQIAKQIIRAELASTDDEKEIAKTNLNHLAAHVKGEIIRLELATTKRAGELIEKIITTLANAVIRLVLSG